MLHVRWLALSFLLTSIAFAPASSQARALIVYGNAGRMFPLTNLSNAGDDLSPGRTYGGGVGLQLGPTTALRINVNISENNLSGQTLSLSDPSLKRSYYGAELMFGAPSNAGLAPYFFVGGGRMTVDPDETGTNTNSKLAGRLGTGVNYVPDNSFFVLFVEVAGWAYQFDLLSFNKLQLDAAVQGGLAFAVPF